MPNIHPKAVTVLDENNDPVDWSSIGGGGGGGDGAVTGPLGRAADAVSVSTALSTEDVALLTALLTTTAFQARIPANGQAAMAASVPVTIASNQSAVPVSAASLPLPSGAATEATLGGVLTTSDFDSKAGSLTEAAPATDTASSGLNGRLQRVAQRLTSLIALFANDATDRIRVSLYGKNSAAGDTAVLLDASGRQIAVGASASGAAVAGNPVLIGASDGTNVYVPKVESSTNPNVRMAIYSGAAGPANVESINGSTTIGGRTSLTVFALMALGDNNGTGQKAYQNVGSLALLSSAARTADTNSSDQTNYNWRGMILILNVSAQSGGSVKLGLQVKDSISGNYVTIWTATAAQTAVGTYVYLIYPGSLSAASWTEIVQAAFGSRTWRLTTTTANGSSITYSVSGDMLL